MRSLLDRNEHLLAVRALTGVFLGCQEEGMLDPVV